MDTPDILKVTLDICLDDIGEDCNAVLASLAIADDNLIQGKIDILDPQPQTFEYPQAAAIHHLCHKLVNPLSTAIILWVSSRVITVGTLTGFLERMDWMSSGIFDSNT